MVEGVKVTMKEHTGILYGSDAWIETEWLMIISTLLTDVILVMIKIAFC